MFALKWVKLMKKEGGRGQSLDGSFMKSLSLQALPLNRGGWVRFPSCTQKCQCVPDVRRNLPKIYSKIKIQTKKKSLKSMENRNIWGGGMVSDLRRMSLTVSPISVWQLMCVCTSTVLMWALWFHTKRNW